MGRRKDRQSKSRWLRARRRVERSARVRHTPQVGSRFEPLEPRVLLSTTFTVTNSADAGAGSLREAIVLANATFGSDVIEFDASVADKPIELTTGELTITDDLTISGPATAMVDIVSIAPGRIFRIEPDVAVVMKNLDLDAEQASGDGGVILNLGKLELDNSFLRTIASSGVRGGAIFNAGTLTVTDGSISAAAKEGGAIYNTGEATIESVDVQGAATGDGGGIYNVGSLTIIVSDITGDASAGSGGAIFNAASGTLETLGVSFSGEYLARRGGAVANLGRATLVNTMAAGNGGAHDEGGTYFNTGTMTLTGGRVALTSASKGGAIYNTGDLSLDGTVILDTNAQVGGGIYNTGVTTATSIDIFTTFADNGGALANIGGTFTLFESSVAGTGGDGAAIRQESGTLNVVDSVVDGSSVDAIAARAGRLQITGSDITDNQRGVFIGADAVAVIRGSTIADHRADNGAGVLNEGELLITDTRIENNRAAGIGGGVVNFGAATIEATTIRGNLGGARAGGIHNEGVLTIDRSIIDANVTGLTGGGIVSEGAGNLLTIRDSSITNNESDTEGDGVFINGGAGHLIVNSTISNNGVARPNGAGIAVASAGATIANSTISGNVIGVWNLLEVASTPGDNHGETLTLVNTIVANSEILDLDFDDTDFVRADVLGGISSASRHNIIGVGDSRFAPPDGVDGNQVGTLNDRIDPRLGVLGRDGGPTFTHDLLEGSPAIDAGDATFDPTDFSPPLLFDQRGDGFDRVVGSAVDIGAFESDRVFGGPIVVTTTADSGVGSLRDAVLLANERAGADTIEFSSTLLETTIELSTGELIITDDVTINGLGRSATAITSGLTSRIFHVVADVEAQISGLYMFDAESASDGHVILNHGVLGLSDIEIQNLDRLEGRGGGIFNDGTLVIEDSTVRASAGEGGGVYNAGTLTAIDSSLTGTAVIGEGGGVYNTGTFSLDGGSLLGLAEDGMGGGLFNAATGTVTASDFFFEGGYRASFGGALANLGGTVTLNNVIAATDSGALVDGGDYYNTGDFTLTGGESRLTQAGNRGGAIYNSGIFRITDYTIKNASSPLGGAIANDGGTVTLTRVTIDDAGGDAAITQIDGTLGIVDSVIQDTNGAGLIAHAGRVLIEGADFVNNDRGGIQIDAGVVAAVTGGSFVGNLGARDGGGIANDGELLVTGTRIEGNTAPNGGGGIFNSGSLTVSGAIILGNDAEIGGGIASSGTDPQLTVRDTVVANNTAGALGGGIFVDDGAGNLIVNSTVSGNDGAGVVVNADTVIVSSTIANNVVGVTNNFADGPILATLVNTIVADNEAADVLGEISTDSRFNIIGVGDARFTSLGGINGNQVGTIDEPVDPRLRPLGRNGGTTFTHALEPGSPAVDAGDPAFDPADFDPALLFDQRGDGFDRVVGPAVDIGAFESDQMFVLPDIFINDVEIVEGDGGLTIARFFISLSETQAFDVQVRAETSQNTATANEDYLGRNEVVTIQAGKEGVNFDVRVGGDRVVEDDETFFVKLSEAVGGVIARETGTGTIVNDDSAPTAVDDVVATYVDQPVRIDVLANDSDPDGDDLTVEIVTVPGGGAVEVNDDGSITFTPEGGLIGESTFTYRAVDTADNASAPAQVQVYIRPTDQPAVAVDDQGGSFTTNEDTPFTTGNVLDNDRTLAGVLPAVESSVEAFRIDSNLIPRTLATGDTAVAVAIPPNSGTEASGFTNAFANADGLRGDVDLLIDAPVFFSTTQIAGGFRSSVVWDDIFITGPESSTQVIARGLLQGFIDVIEVFGPTFSIAQVSASVVVRGAAVGGGTTSASAQLGTAGQNIIDDTLFSDILQTGPITIDTRFALTIEFQFGVRVSASTQGQAASGGMYANFLQGLTLVPEEVLLLEDGFTANSVSASIFDNQLVPRSAGGDLSIVDVDTTGTVGNVTPNGDGTFDYDPNGQFEHLREGESAFDAFTYTIEDTLGNSDTGQVTIEVTGVNVAPVGEADTYRVMPDVPLVVDALEGVLDNDSDAEDDTVSVASFDDSDLRGSLALESDGSFNFTPEAGFVGETHFSYVASDGDLSSDATTVTILVAADDADVIAVNDQGNGFATDEDTPFTTGNVLDNDLNLQGDELPAVVSEITAQFLQRESPSVTDTNTASVTWSDSFGAAAVSGTVNAYANADGVGGTIETDVFDTDFFYNNQINGRIIGEVTWSDIMISGPEDVAEISAIAAVQGMFDGTESNLLGTAGTIFGFMLITGTAPGGGTVSALGAYEGSNIGITYPDDITIDRTFRTVPRSFDIRFPITVTMTIRVTTSLSSGTSQDISGEMSADFPRAVGFPQVGDVFALPEGYTVNSVSASIVDNRLVPRGTDGDVLSITDIDTSDTIGTVTSNGDGTFDYDPNGQFEHLREGEFAIDTFEYTIVDGRGNSDTATVEVRVDGVNDEPIGEDDAYEVEVGDALFISIADLLENDTDPENDPLIFTGVDGAGLKGMIDFASDEKLVFVPDADFVGMTRFMYQIQDPDGAIGGAYVDINVVEPAQADVGIVVEGPGGTRVLGEVFEYTATITNNGPDTAENVVVSAEPFITSVGMFLSASPSQGDGSDPLLVRLGDLAAGASATITYELRADEVGSINTIFRVNSSAIDPEDGNDARLVQNSAAREPLDVSVVLSDRPERVLIGDLVEFTLTVTNNGPIRAELAGAGLQLRGVEVEVVSVTPSVGGIGDLPTSVEFGPLEVGESANVTYVFRATTLGQATIAFAGGADHIELTPEDNIVGVALDVILPQSDVVVTVAGLPDTVRVGDPLTLVATIANLGPDAAGNVTIQHLLGNGLELLDTRPSQGDFDDLQSRFDLGDIAVGATAAIEYDLIATTEGPTGFLVGGGPNASTDENTDNNVVTLAFEVLPANEPPVAVDDVYEIAEDNTLVVAAPGLLANDSDPDGDAIVARLVSQPRNGTVSLKEDGSFVYTPDANFNGTDTFAYEAVDPMGEATQASVGIRVLSAAEQRAMITQMIQSIVTLSRGEQQSLVSKLKPNGSARGELGRVDAFMNQLDALGKTQRLTASSVATLKALVAALKFTIGN